MNSADANSARVTVQRRIDWGDTDLAGVCHYPVFARLVDAAESLLFDRLGLMEAFIRLPRRALDVEFLRPLYFNDIVHVDYMIGHVGVTSVKAEFRVTRDQEVTITGSVTSTLLEDGQSTPWPDEWRRLLMTGGHLGVESLSVLHG